jgi:hypothetical protein
VDLEEWRSPIAPVSLPNVTSGHAPKSVRTAAGRVWRRGGARRRQLTWVKAADRGVALLGVARPARRASPKAPGGHAPKSVEPAAARARRRGGARRRRLTWVKAVVLEGVLVYMHSQRAGWCLPQASPSRLLNLRTGSPAGRDFPPQTFRPFGHLVWVGSLSIAARPQPIEITLGLSQVP